MGVVHSGRDKGEEEQQEVQKGSQVTHQKKLPVQRKHNFLLQLYNRSCFHRATSSSFSHPPLPPPFPLLVFILMSLFCPSFSSTRSASI